jgi:hypothetical protein
MSNNKNISGLIGNSSDSISSTFICEESNLVWFLEIILPHFVLLHVNPSGKTGTQIPQLPLGDNSSPWGDNAICT